MIRYLLILLVIITTEISFAQKDTSTPVVLELFTSQGCSSCPPADILLESIKNKYKDENVYVLSYHVDYWNRLGWKDPFSKKEYSDYQSEYAAQFNSKRLYTPQLIVNGSTHFTGSDRNKLEKALYEYKNSETLHIIKFESVKKNENTIEINFNIEGDGVDRITFTLVIAKRITKVDKGENRSRILNNSNIVVAKKVESKVNGIIQLSIPYWVQPKDQFSIIAYTQDKKYRVTGANKIAVK